MFKDKGARNAINKLEEMIKEKMDLLLDTIDERSVSLANSIRERILEKNYAECDKCGCLVKKEKAIKQQTLEEKKYLNFITERMENSGEKYIKTVYLCKHCLTKKK